MAIKDLHRVIDHIIKVVFSAEDRRIAAWVDKLCIKNQEIHPQSVGFIYSGDIYRPSNVIGQLPRAPALDISHWAEMDNVLSDKKIISNEKAFIRQSLVGILESCSSEQDIRDAMPECIVDTLPQNIQQLRRTRSEAFTIAGDPRKLRQFEKVRNKLEVYATGRLIY